MITRHLTITYFRIFIRITSWQVCIVLLSELAYWLKGLRRKAGFTGQIYCTRLTRDLLLRLEPASERVLFVSFLCSKLTGAHNSVCKNVGLREQRVRPYYIAKDRTRFVHIFYYADGLN